MPRAKRKAATISQTVGLAKPASASCTGTSPNSVDAVIANSATAPAGKGRVISATTVAAKSESRPQARASIRACGSSQMTAPAMTGTSQRQCWPPARARSDECGTTALDDRGGGVAALLRAIDGDD